jgi:hypothetical protein
MFGGVILVREDRDDISSIADLKDQVIAAAGIAAVMGGQMQIYEMFKAGMSYVNDPKQVIFTGNQADIVLGVLSGLYDVGFVRTEVIESTKDANGELVDPTSFKILDPKVHILEDGSLFPFVHSTEIIPEWPVAALAGVPGDVQGLVQGALMEFGEFVALGEKINSCRTTANETWCNSVDLREIFPDAPCMATYDLAMKAYEALSLIGMSGFRTPLSYFDIRTMHQEAGFLVRNEDKEWACTTQSNLFEGITCPAGFFKVSPRPPKRLNR